MMIMLHNTHENLVVEGEGPNASSPDAEMFYVDFLYNFART